MRLFLAVDIDESLIPAIKEVQTALKSANAKIVGENNLHLTLKFLGEVPEALIPEIISALKTIKTSPFEIVLAGAGAFPTTRSARVAWIGVQGEEFVELSNAVNEALSRLFKKEKASPHLTLARFRTAVDLSDFINRKKDINIGSMRAAAIKLKKSTLRITGPIYDDVRTIALGEHNA